MNTRDSLGGQNKGGRTTGARSSRASSTIFNKLRKLDREISLIDQHIDQFSWCNDTYKLNQKRKALDDKRKLVRNARKAIDSSDARVSGTQQ